MRILVDTTWSGSHGIGRFAAEVSRRLEGTVPFHGPLPPSSPLYPIWLSTHLSPRDGDVLFSPGYAPPLRSTIPFVLTLHDLIHLDVPGLRGAAHRLYYETVIRRALRQAAGVLTVSEHARARIGAWSGMPADRIVNVGNGVSECFRPDGEQAHLDRPYLLHVGAHRPHKNLPRLIAAFARSGLGARVSVAFTGPPDPRLIRIACQAGIAGSLHFTGHVTDASLAAYYRGAVALLLPSLSEGFGLPVVEAMACGTPVVASRAGALPEVAGSAALFADPVSVDAIAAAMLRAVDDEPLRAHLRAAGLSNAARFSWDATAACVQQELVRAVGRGVNGSLRIC